MNNSTSGLVTLSGVTGVVVAVDHRYTDNDGAYEVVSLETSEGIVKVKAIGSMPVYSMPQGETDDQKRARMNQHFAKRAATFRAMNTRSGRLLAIVAESKLRIA